MSTSYYYLREPITRVAVLIHDTERADVVVDVASRLAGVLAVHPQSIPDLLRMFSEQDADDFHCPMRTSFGGLDRGCVVTENTRGLDPNLQLVDEYGELHTVAEIRAFAGAGKGTDAEIKEWRARTAGAGSKP